MGFWGIEVKPGKPYPYHADNVQGKLHVTQATLGTGSSTEKSILQCSSGHKSPVFLCSLLPSKIESCPLNLEFHDDDIVAFSVIGSRSIHLSGYFVADDGDDLRDDYEYDSFGEDIEGTETEESSEYDTEDEYADDFIDDSDIDMYPSSAPNSGVVIEEILDDDEPENKDDSTKQLKKKKQVSQLKEKDSRSSQLPIVVRHETAPPVPESEDDVVESEDEDGFPISAAEKGKSESPKEEAEMKEEQAHKKTEKANKKAKRKVESADEDEKQQDGKKKKKKKNKLKEDGKEGSVHASGNGKETNVNKPDENHPEDVKTTLNLNNVSQAKDGQHDTKLSNNKAPVEKKNKKKKKKTKESEGVAPTTVENKDLSTAERKGKKQTEAKPSQVRTFPNGLVIEELFMGKPDGKRAAPGKKVSVKYIGKLKKDGKIFDSNVGRAPFKFRLGVGQVIKGWEVGVNGMRIGDKRRITVPPSMGYGAKPAGSIPPNSWLVFDVELVDVDR